MTETPHSRWPSLQEGLAVATIVASVAVPIATTVIAGRFAAASAERDANVRLVEIAAGILQETPEGPGSPLRAWAVSVIDQYSVVKLPPNVRRVLADSTALHTFVGFVGTPYVTVLGLGARTDTTGLPPFILRPHP